MIDPSKRLLFAARSFVAASQTWLYRQACGIRDFDVHVVAWERCNQNDYPFDTKKLTVIDGPAEPNDTKARWVHRLRNAPTGNFYGSTGREKGQLKTVATDHADVILANFGQVALRMLPVGLDCRVPIVAHFHGVDLTASMRNRYYRRSLAAVVQKFSAVVCVADYQAEILTNLGASQDAVHVIPCGVPMASPEATATTANGSCRFLMVGRLTSKKRPDLTIRAFAVVAKADPSVRMTIIGDGEMRNSCEDIARRVGVQDQIRWLGEQSNEVVQREMARADVFVQHSMTSDNGDMEGWPVSIAEAAMTGLPVVSTRHAGIPSQVIEGQTGYLVEEGDWSSMAERMRQLADHPERRRAMGGASQNHIAQFDTATQIQKLEAVVESVL